MNFDCSGRSLGGIFNPGISNLNDWNINDIGTYEPRALCAARRQLFVNRKLMIVLSHQRAPSAATKKGFYPFHARLSEGQGVEGVGWDDVQAITPGR